VLADVGHDMRKTRDMYPYTSGGSSIHLTDHKPPALFLSASLRAAINAFLLDEHATYTMQVGLLDITVKCSTKIRSRNADRT